MKRLKHAGLAAFTAAALCLTAAAGRAAPAPGAQLALAKAALQNGEADRALALLGDLARPGGPAEAYNLRCRVELTLEDWDRAVGDCQQAVRLDGQNSVDHMWLGRALGEKAQRASFLTAYSLGKQVRQQFELAVQLDPRNGPALADLGEFYDSAPGFMGGGMDQAEAVAARLDRIDPERACALRAEIAEQNKDYGSAERDLKQAIAVSPHPALAWMELASFYRRRSRWAEMESAVRGGQSAAGRDKRAGVALYNGAAVLIRANRDPERAIRMLEDYLAGGSKSEEAPAFVAYTRLARLEMQQGDPAAAGRDRAAALALAAEYKPARDLQH
ncbi:MAG: tetratricopeptide repeat protein [Terracidiphilus sp.]